MQSPLTTILLLFVAFSAVRAQMPSIRVAEANCLTVTAQAFNVSCFGDDSGSANASANGGQGPYQFSWQGCLGGPIFSGAMVNNLFAGCYNVTATDASGCSGTATVTVLEPSPLRFSLVVDSVSCYAGNDGQVMASAKGGTPNYRYRWSNGQTGTVATGYVAGIHTLEVTDSLGCRASSTFEVPQPPPISIDSLPFVRPTCPRDQDGSITAFASGGTPPLTYYWSAQAGARVGQLAAGTYTVTVEDANGCTAERDVVLLDPPPARLFFSNIIHEQCPGACNGSAVVRAAMAVAPYDLLLNWLDIVRPIQEGVVGPLCPGLYTVRIIDANNCVAADSFRIDSAFAPTIRFDSTVLTCAGAKDGSLQANLSFGPTPYTYRWSNGATQQRINGLDCGFYKVTITDAANCSHEDSVQLSCPQGLQFGPFLLLPPRCVGESNGAMTVRVSGGTPPLTYSWSDPNNQSAATANNLTAGKYQVTVRDARGCSLVLADTLPEPPPILVSLSPTPVRCFGGSDGRISAFVSGGIGPYQYTWSNMDTDSIAEGLVPGVYLLAAQDANGCRAAVQSATITAPDAPVRATAQQTKRACFGSNDGQATAGASGGNPGGYTYRWSNNQMGQMAAQLGPSTYTVTVQDAKGCSDTISVRIEQLDSIQLGLISAPPTCFGGTDGSIGINQLRRGGANLDTTTLAFIWNVPGAPNTTLLTGLPEGIYTLTVRDADQCTATDMHRVQAGPKVQPLLRITPVRCFGAQNGALRVDTVLATRPIFSYIWSNRSQGVVINDLSPGTYTVTVSDEKGCSGTASADIAQPDSLSLRFELVGLRCAGDRSGQIATFIQGGTQPYRLLWNNNDTLKTLKNLGAGTYTLSLSDQNGCSLVRSAFIPTPDSLGISATVQEPTCFGDDDGRIVLSVSGGNEPYRYRLNDGAFGGSTVFFRLKAGTYWLQVRDDNGCMSSVTVPLAQPQPLQVDLGLDTTLLPGGRLELSPSISNAFGQLRYQWSALPLDSIACLDALCSEVEVAPLTDTRYALRVTDERGCRGNGTVSVSIPTNRQVLVPTGFTPNGDGNNDVLMVHGSPTYLASIRHMAIYDRWGELVYEAEDLLPNDPARTWDGTFRGQPCNPGVFVWRMEVLFTDGAVVQLTGGVTLIR